MTAGRDALARPAVIFSTARDRINFGPVADALRDAGLDVVELCFDDVLSGLQRLAVEISNGRATVSCDGHVFDTGDVLAAWWRKPQWVRVERTDAVRRISIELELERTAHALASLIPACAWLNAPDAMRGAESKLRQLVIADRLGFFVPPTHIGNDWDAIRCFASTSDMVFKSLRGGLWSADGNQMVFTTCVGADRLDQLAGQGHTPWPGLFQARVAGRREWRVYVIGDEVVGAVIELNGDLVDWRKHQLSQHVRFAAAQPDPWLGAACIDLTRAFGLGYGAIDLIEDRDGRMWFLEINSNGQYGWLEQELELPFTRLLTRQLLLVARANESDARRAARADAAIDSAPACRITARGHPCRSRP
jgi:hypothetical protein